MRLPLSDGEREALLELDVVGPVPLGKPFDHAAVTPETVRSLVDEGCIVVTVGRYGGHVYVITAVGKWALAEDYGLRAGLSKDPDA